VGEHGLPNTQFKFMEKVGDKHGKKVETELGESCGKGALVGIRQYQHVAQRID